MEQQEHDIITRMNDKYMKMSKGHKAVAAYISDHYEQAVFMTAAKLGETVGVSESTVVRFASGLGYAGYPEFQKALEEWVRSKLNTVQKMGAKYGKSSQVEILHSVLGSDIEKIQDTIVNLDAVAFEAAVDIILEARTVYLVGVRSCEPLADFLHFYLNMIRGNIVLVKTTSVTEIFEQMIRIDEEDAIIGISFPRYSTRSVRAMEFARDQGATVVAVTDSEMSPLYDTANYRLLAKSDMASFADSLVAPLSIINALIVAVGRKKSTEVTATFKRLESIWDEYQVYEKVEYGDK